MALLWTVSNCQDGSSFILEAMKKHILADPSSDCSVKLASILNPTNAAVAIPCKSGGCEYQSNLPPPVPPSKAQIPLILPLHYLITFLLSLPVIDAMGKPISGLTVGNWNWLGNYDLCLELKAADLYPCRIQGPVPSIVVSFCV